MTQQKAGLLIEIVLLVIIAAALWAAIAIVDAPPPATPQPCATVEWAYPSDLPPTATPQTEPKAYALVPIRDDGEWCMGRIYTTEPLPIEDPGFMAPFELLDLEKDYVGSGYQYFFRTSPLWNCSNVHQNVEAATRP